MVGRLAGERPAREDVLHADLSVVLRRHIRRLPARQQAALVLRHLENMAYPRIAELMEIDQSTVRVLVRNAREALRQALTRENPEWANTRTSLPRGRANEAEL